jgi:NitT/TauT family transport system permease protein
MLYGLKSFDKKLLEMGRQFGFGFKKNLRYIYWPSLKPFVNSALAAGISLNMKVLVAAEVFGQPNRAIGTNLFNSKAFIDTPGIFAWSLIVIILSYAIEQIIMSLKTKKQ